ncbi:hypothetical protein FKP32DRAFT_681960 [Trametes sanguinea]|nr:hypothetical protein FKP32DRAFT_681960 [Trametes sanguinea]
MPVCPPPHLFAMPVRTKNERNVFLCDYHGTVLAGFYQYGTVTWKTFLRWLSSLIDTPQSWIVLSGDRYASETYFPSDNIVLPGKNTLLASDLSPLHVKLISAHARRQRSPLSRATKSTLNLHHSRLRSERQCMMSQHELCWCTLQAAHLISETHPTEVRFYPRRGPNSRARTR